MKIEWLYEAQAEYRELLHYHKTKVGPESARRFSKRILKSVELLAQFPEMGLLKEERLLGKFGFRALFIDKYVCIYRRSELAEEDLEGSDLRPLWDQTAQPETWTAA